MSILSNMFAPDDADASPYGSAQSPDGASDAQVAPPMTKLPGEDAGDDTTVDPSDTSEPSNNPDVIMSTGDMDPGA